MLKHKGRHYNVKRSCKRARAVGREKTIGGKKQKATRVSVAWMRPAGNGEGGGRDNGRATTGGRKEGRNARSAFCMPFKLRQHWGLARAVPGLSRGSVMVFLDSQRYYSFSCIVSNFLHEKSEILSGAYSNCGTLRVAFSLPSEPTETRTPKTSASRSQQLQVLYGYHYNLCDFSVEGGRSARSRCYKIYVLSTISCRIRIGVKKTRINSDNYASVADSAKLITGGHNPTNSPQRIDAVCERRPMLRLQHREAMMSDWIYLNWIWSHTPTGGERCATTV